MKETLNGQDHAKTDAGLPPRGTPKNYLMAWLLVMLKDLNLHGYEIMKALRENFAVVSDPGTVYRALRQLERDGYITSWWDPKEQGPARRVYTLTGPCRSEEHTSELQSRSDLVCRLL